MWLLLAANIIGSVGLLSFSSRGRDGGPGAPPARATSYVGDSDSHTGSLDVSFGCHPAGVASMTPPKDVRAQMLGPCRRVVSIRYAAE